MNEKLEVVISADISALSKELQAANKLLQQHERNYKGVQDAISTNTQRGKDLEGQIKRLNSEFKNGSISQQDYSKQTSSVTQEMRDVSSSTKDYQRELKRLGGEIERTKNYTESYSFTAAKAAEAAKKLEGGSKKLGDTTNRNTLPAMTSFANILTDLPRGAGAVSSSIESFIARMGSLQKSAGGTGQALKLMASSLMGPAGVLLAITTVTTIIATLSSSGVKLSDVLRAVTFSSDKFAKAQREIAEASREAEGSVMGEIEVLKSLVNVAKDESRARGDRQRAIDAINRMYPELHENLNLETIGSEKAAIAVDKLTQSLLRQAKIEGVKGLISDTYAEMAELATKAAVDGVDGWDMLLMAMNPVNAANEIVLRGAKNNSKEFQKLTEKTKTLSDALQGLITEDIELKGVFTDPAKTKIEKRIPVKAVLEFDPNIDSQIDQNAIKFNKALQSQMDQLAKLRSYFGKGTPEYKRYTDDIQALEDRFTQNISFLENYASKVGESFVAHAKESNDALLQRNADAKLLNQQFVEDNLMAAALIGNAFTNMANQIADGLISGEMSMTEFTEIFMKSMAQILIQAAQTAIMEKIIGKAKIGTQYGVSMGNAAVAATSSAAAMGPAGVIALPGLMASMGGIVSGFFAGIQGFAEGGIVGGSSYHGDKILARLNSGELILNNNQQRRLNGMMTPNMNGSGSNNIELNGGFVIQGETIRMVLDRSDKRTNRIT